MDKTQFIAETIGRIVVFLAINITMLLAVEERIWKPHQRKLGILGLLIIMWILTPFYQIISQDKGKKVK